MSLRVAFATDAPDHEESAAILGWLRGPAGVEARAAVLADLGGLEGHVVWIHGVEPVALNALGPSPERLLRRGRLLLTGGATALPSEAGLDDAAPDVRPRLGAPAATLLGHATYRGHPLFQGLGVASHTSRAEPEGRSAGAAVVWPRCPRARVLAVEWRDGEIVADRATIWEYDGEEGPVLCIGAHFPLHTRDPVLRTRVLRLATNALERVAGRMPGDGSWGCWRPPEAGAREDRGLALPELPLMEEPLGPPEFRLRMAGVPRPGRRFVVPGRRLYTAGSEAGGIEEVWAHPLRLISGLALGDFVAERVTVTPAGVERRLRRGNAVVLERVVVPREAPVALLEWESRNRSVDLALEWRCDLRLSPPYPPGAVGGLRWRRTGRGVVVAGAGEERAVFGFSDRPEALEVNPVGDAGEGVVLRARFRLHAHNSVRMVVVGGSGDAPSARAMRVADRTVAAVRSAQAHAEQVLSDGLVLDAPDTRAVQAVHWSKLRLGSCLAESPGVGRSLLDGYGSVVRYGSCSGVLGALAALVAGEHRAARDTLTFLGRHQSPDGRVPTHCSTAGPAEYGGGWSEALYLLLAARYHAWTGDTAMVQAEWPRVLRAYEVLLEDEGAGSPPRALADSGIDAAGLPAVALKDLATTAESIGDRGAAVEIGRAAAARGRTSPIEAAAVAGAGPGLLPRFERFEAWHERIRWLFRAAAADGAEPGGADGAVAGGAGPEDAAAVLLPLVHELLGAEADAGRGRLVLRPAPPARWPRFAVRNLRLGEAAVGLAYRRREGVHSFRLQQDRGATPVRLILEPALPGRGLRAARVDGGPAELDARVADGRVVVPLQVVLDHPRTVELEVEPGTAG